MNTKKIFSGIALGCGLVALFLIARAWQRTENLGDSLPKNDTTVTETQEYPTLGAIARAKGLSSESFQSLKKEASRFGLYLWPSDKAEYKQIRDRLFANDKLASALRTAKKEGVSVYLEREFGVRTGYANINIDATDQEIIEFLTTSTPEAKARKAVFNKLHSEASQFGIYLFSSDVAEYKQIRDRLFANDKLASALRTANKEGVNVYLEREFRVSTGYANINIDATDQEIIEFLLGKQTKKKY